MTSGQFSTLRQQGFNWIPIVTEIDTTAETPLSLYLKLANRPDTFLLEYGLQGEAFDRYTFIGLKASRKILVQDHQFTIIDHNKITAEYYSDNPLNDIQALFNQYRVPKVTALPGLTGGFVGYFGYDTIRYIEPRLDQFSKNDPLNIPDIYLLIPEQLVVYDNVTQKLTILVYVNPNDQNAYQFAQQEIVKIKESLQSSIITTPSKQTQPTEFVSNFKRDDYEHLVDKAREYFYAGDAMQLILSQRFSKNFTVPAINLYQTLRQVNPSPYMYYFNLVDFEIVGASPEILVHLSDQQITVRPLAGTRRRGTTEAQDKALEKELLSDTKEVAEHLMLIDLGRNDIGRICETGTVKVTQQMVIERFSHVMHISSTVVGTVKAGIPEMDILRATFPAGTVSGAPKIRAMEIIDELETDKRALYGGAVGYFNWQGDIDVAIALRTAIIKDKTIHIQTGAGLVADSIPENEWQECINKATALFLATQQTEHNFTEEKS